ncbi:hypothetical protein BC832DRAFT_591750 [Gaertneriomyces semiglobifer]|nr:hypothetical protein BC832DRAFT_591750 [Gaertneriomyces semiglobifer]
MATESTGPMFAIPSDLFEEFDRLPLLRPPQLNNVQDVSSVAWFSARDGKPYVRIKLRTKGTVCRACFHDLSPRKQQDLIDRLRAKREGRPTGGSTGAAPELPNEEESERLLQLIIYMNKYKRTQSVSIGGKPSADKLQEDGDENSTPQSPRERPDGASPRASARPARASQHNQLPGIPGANRPGARSSPVPSPLIHLPPPFPTYFAHPHHSGNRMTYRYSPYPTSHPHHGYPSHPHHPHPHSATNLWPAAHPEAPDPTQLPQVSDSNFRSLYEECSHLRVENQALRDALSSLRREHDELRRESSHFHREMVTAKRETETVRREVETRPRFPPLPAQIPPYLHDIYEKHTGPLQSSLKDTFMHLLLAVDKELRSPKESEHT